MPVMVSLIWIFERLNPVPELVAFTAYRQHQATCEIECDELAGNWQQMLENWY